MDVRFTFLIDWDSDDDWSDAYEDVSLYVKSANWSLGMSQPYALMGGETRLSMTLENKDQRFSPENSASPYYGQLVPQRKVKVQTTYAGTTRTMYVGWIDSIEPESGDGRTCMLQCVGAKQFIQDQTIRLPLLENLRSDEIIQAILERLQTPPALSGLHWALGLDGTSELGVSTYLADLAPSYDLAVGETTFPYIADSWDRNFYGNQYVGESWDAGFKGWDAIEDAVKAERGRFFFNREGVAIFWARSYIQTQIALDATFDNEHSSGDYRYGDDIVNDVRVKVYPRQISDTPVTLYELDEPIELRPASKLKRPKAVQAKFTDADSGVDIAGYEPYVDQFVVAEGTSDAGYTVEFQARGARLELYNHTEKPVTITTIVIKGRRLTSWDETEAQVINGASRVAYGWKEYIIDSKLQANLNLAESIADYEIYRRKDPIGVFHSIEVQAVDAARTAQIVTRTIGDRIRVVDAQTLHDAEYFIIGETHSWGLRQGYRVRWNLERADAQLYWMLGTVGYSELGETTYLGL